MTSVVLQFNSTKAGIVHKYNNHGFVPCPTSSKRNTQVRGYTTKSSLGTGRITLVQQLENSASATEVAVRATPQLQRGTAAATDMVNYLKNGAQHNLFITMLEPFKLLAFLEKDLSQAFKVLLPVENGCLVAHSTQQA